MPRIRIPVAAAAATVAVALASAAPAHAVPKTAFTAAELSRADARVTKAVNRRTTVTLRLLVRRAKRDPAVAKALVDHASVWTKTTRAGTSPIAGRGPAGAQDLGTVAGGKRCRGPVTTTTTIGFSKKIKIGWRKATVNEWCASGGRIVSQEFRKDDWSAFGFCWKDENDTDLWLIRPSRMAYYNKGTLAGIAPWGCAGGQQTIAPGIHFDADGRFNRYATDPASRD